MSAGNSLQGKRVWITGASSGIGKALAISLVEQGCKLVISARNAESLEMLADQLSIDTAYSHSKSSQNSEVHLSPPQQSDRQVTALSLDLASELDAQAVHSTLEESLGEIDVCVACAGHCEYLDDINNIDIDMFKRVFETNFFGAVRTVKAALPFMSEQASTKRQGFSANSSSSKKPLIVFVSSLATVVSFPRAEAYGASKSALSYFAESLRLDLIDRGVDVLLVEPGFVETPMTDKNDFDMPLLMATDEAAQRIINAIDRHSAYSAFPRRLAWMLRLFSYIPCVWRRWVGPSLRKPVH